MRTILPTVIAIVSMYCMPFGLIAEPTTTVVVSEFEDRTGSRASLGSRAQEEITNILVKLPQVQIVERARMDEIVEEMNFSRSAYVDSSTAAEFGKKAGADYVIFGSVSNASYEESRQAKLFGEGSKRVGSSKVAMNVQIVDVETNTTTFSETMEGEATDDPNPDAVVPMALVNAVSGMAIPLQEKFPIEGYVIKKEVKDKDHLVYVDVGKNAGIDKGREVTIFSKGEEIVHPVTGEVLSSSTGTEIASGEVSSVMDQFSIVDIRRRDFDEIEVGHRFAVEPAELPKQGKGIGNKIRSIFDR